MCNSVTHILSLDAGIDPYIHSTYLVISWMVVWLIYVHSLPSAKVQPLIFRPLTFSVHCLCPCKRILWIQWGGVLSQSNFMIETLTCPPVHSSCQIYSCLQVAKRLSMHCRLYCFIKVRVEYYTAILRIGSAAIALTWP